MLHFNFCCNLAIFYLATTKTLSACVTILPFFVASCQLLLSSFHFLAKIVVPFVSQISPPAMDAPRKAAKGRRQRQIANTNHFFVLSKDEEQRVQKSWGASDSQTTLELQKFKYLARFLQLFIKKVEKNLRTFGNLSMFLCWIQKSKMFLKLFFSGGSF